MIPKLLVTCCLFILFQASAFSQAGNATYYHKKLYGRTTSTGETLDPAKYTAASKQYPWGTILLVTNTDNGRSVQVRVNDCGPQHPDAVLDLSQAAADELQMNEAGRVPVLIQVVRPSTAGPTCHRGAWAKKLKAKGQPIPPPPPAWDPAETVGILPLEDLTNGATPAVQPLDSTQGLVGFYPMNADQQRTSTGETYTHGALTAASRTYPYNTILELTNVVNGQAVRVRVNDCGPVQPGRVLNVSRSAAFDLDILATGPSQVHIKVIKPGEGGPTCRPQKAGKGKQSIASAPPAGDRAADTAPAQSFDPDAMLFGIKLGAFKNEQSAKALIARAKENGLSPVFILDGGGLHRVYAGKFYFQSEAEAYREVARESGFRGAVVRRVQ